MASELGRVIEQVEKDKGIARAVLVEALELAPTDGRKKEIRSRKRDRSPFQRGFGRN